MAAPTRRRLLALAGLGLAGPGLSLAGCASANPDYFRLTMVPGSPLPSTPRRIEVRQAGLPRYLDRSEIVRGGDGARLKISDNALWASPLGEMVTRVLVEDLAQRLPGATVFAEGGGLGLTPDMVAEVAVTRFEADAQGVVVLEALVAARRLGGDGKGESRPVQARVAAGGTGNDALAQAMSQALAKLADEAAGLLVRVPVRG